MAGSPEGCVTFAILLDAAERAPLSAGTQHAT